MEEIELNFQLDEHGRTTKPPSEPSSHENSSNDVRPSVDYQSHAVMTNLEPPIPDTDIHRKWLDELLFDCQISDSGLMPRTFWVPSRGMKPRCHLEQMAYDIFHHHVPPGLEYDEDSSGAEWWAQIRPSPEGTGRYSMHDDQPDELSTKGISFHWDKDEELRELTGGTTYIHPHISTVTYLTDLGAPTLVLNRRIHSLTGEWISSDDDMVEEGFISWPRTGKHMSFDGRFLHAAPADLMEIGEWERQRTIVFPSTFYSEKDIEVRKRQEKLFSRRHRRVTFLVNIWLNYKPYDIQPFPNTMIDKMSGVNETERIPFLFQHDSRGERTEDIQVSSSSELTQTLTWAMGDCDSQEVIDVILPLEVIRKQAIHGGNSRIRWDKTKSKDDVGIRLYLKTSTKKKRKTHNDDDENDSNEETKSPKSSQQ